MPISTLFSASRPVKVTVADWTPQVRLDDTRLECLTQVFSLATNREISRLPKMGKTAQGVPVGPRRHQQTVYVSIWR